LRRARVLLAVSGAALLALPSAALGADAYVDAETGGAAPCGAQNDPCMTISDGVAAAGAGDTIHVDDRPDGMTYNHGISSIVLGAGKSLIGEEFVGGDESSLAEPDAIVQSSDVVSHSATLRVQAGSAAGTIQNLRLRSGQGSPLLLEDAATVTGNVFDSDTAFSDCDIQVQTAGNDSTIGPDNAFADPAPGGALADRLDGVCVDPGAEPEVSENTFTGMNDGVLSNGGDTVIRSNTFTGTVGSTTDAAIRVIAGVPEITANLVGPPAPGDSSAGIWVEQPGVTDTGAVMRRNVVLGHRIGLAVNDTEPAVEMNGDLIAGSTAVGMAVNDSMNDDGTFINAFNVTVTDSVGAEISLSNTSLTLGSSIVGGGGISAAGDGLCGIGFSRGPSIVPGGNGCAAFQTTAAPGFVNPATDDYHLAPGSAMIDMGDPAAPAPGVLDIDGSDRETDGNGDGVARRDIGADETAAVPPAPPGSGQPSTPAPAKPKCKKRKKKRVAGAAKKKRKKCKRKRKRRSN
jgi:hypothetical protein